MSSIAWNFYSDVDMQDPVAYHGGFKEARVEQFGDAERALSNLVTGDWQGASCSLKISDYDRSIRERLASPQDRFWSQPLVVRMVDRATRAALGTPYTVFVGQIIDAKPVAPLSWEITLGDHVAQTILSDEAQQPWRKIADGFLDQLTTIDEHLDRDTPEPIIYGQNRRVPEDSPASQHGFEILPTYLGIMDVGGNALHVWLVAGHACADVTEMRVDKVSVLANEGSDWFIPHYAGHAGLFDGNPYNDFTSSTYGTTRRYTLIFGTVTDMFAEPADMTDPDACAAGHKQLTVAVDGIEPNGDGSGAVITDRIQQYKHFLINYVANRGQDSYQSGAWLNNPTWSTYDGTIEIVEESSFDDCSAIGEERLPQVDPSIPAGYIGAVVIGARSGERASVRRWIAEFNRSCAVRFGVTHVGQLRVVMLHPTTTIKEAAPLYTDVNDVMEGTFATNVLWEAQANAVPYKGDYNHATGVWMTSEIARDADAITNYEREILGQERDYPFAPGITALNHLAQLELLINRHPMRVVVFEASIGPDALGDSIAYLDLGDYLRYRHFAAVSNDSTEIRLAQVISHQVQAGSRRVRIEALDCEDLIGYDMPPPDISAFFGIQTPVTQTMMQQTRIARRGTVKRF